MVLEYPTIVTLSNRINPDGTLKEDVRIRVDSSVELYKIRDRGLYGLTITMSGKEDSRDLHFPLTHAEAMRRYAIQKGVPENDILKEEWSKDAVGQTFLSKKLIFLPRGWNKGIVVSSDYCMPRVEWIFKFIFGPEFDLVFRGADTRLDLGRVKLTAEEKGKMAYTKMFFKGIKPGNDKDIADVLLERHAIYNKEKELYADLFYGK